MDNKLKLDIYRKMLLSRRLEERVAELIKAGQVGGFMHAGVGQEALQVAALANMRPDDYCSTPIAEWRTGLRGESLSKRSSAIWPARRAAPTAAKAV
jgi:hypothetical protein